MSQAKSLFGGFRLGRIKIHSYIEQAEGVFDRPSISRLKAGRIVNTVLWRLSDSYCLAIARQDNDEQILAQLKNAIEAISQVDVAWPRNYLPFQAIRPLVVSLCLL